MAITMSTIVMAAALASGPVPDPHATAPAPHLTSIAAAAGHTGVSPAADTTPRPAASERWMHDWTPSRPAVLPVMYVGLGALQALDAYSTRRAVAAGARELNPAMRAAAGSSGAMLAAKALSTAGSIYFTERLWKKNRKGAIVLMAVVNGVTAAVAANNLRNAR